MPHSFIHSLTHPLTSAYSFLSRTHMPLFIDDSFIHTTHSYSDLLTNRSHVPYPLCFLISSFSGRCSPIQVNNRVDISSHASLLHVFKKSVAGGISPQLCYLRKSSALLHIGAYGLVRGQLQIVSSHPDLSSFLSRLSCTILVSSLNHVGLWTTIQQEIRLSEGTHTSVSTRPLRLQERLPESTLFKV